MPEEYDYLADSDEDICLTMETALELPQTDSSDSDAHTSGGYRYGRREVKGAQYQDWIDGNEQVRCPVKPATLVLNDNQVGLDVEVIWHPAGDKHSPKVITEAINMGLGPGPGPRGAYADVRVWQPNEVSELNPQGAKNRWVAYIGQGFMSMPEIFRLKSGSYSSDIFQAIYTHFYTMDTLSTCFVTSVVNFNTRKFLTRLYTAKGYACPDDLGMMGEDDDVAEIIKPRDWVYGTPEYKALLGTRIGGVVATLVLGSFPRGTKRITQIRTVFTCVKDICYSVDIRFDIRDSV